MPNLEHVCIQAQAMKSSIAKQIVTLGRDGEAVLHQAVPLSKNQACLLHTVSEAESYLGGGVGGAVPLEHLAGNLGLGWPVP